MASHFDCLGVPAGSDEELSASLTRAASVAQRRTADDGTVVLVATDPSGMRLAMTLDGRGQIQCITPSFDGAIVTPATVGSLRPNDCPFEWPLLIDALGDDGESCYPLALQIEDLAISRAAFVAGTQVELKMAALAEAIEVFEPSDDHSAGPRMADESLIPMGAFALPGREADFKVNPRISMSGTVLSAEIRTNELYGRQFAYLLVRSYCRTFDVVAPATLLVSNARPASVKGVFWLSARLVDRQSAEVV